MGSDVVLSTSFFKIDLRIVRRVSGARHFYVHVKTTLLCFISGNNREAGRSSFAFDWAKSLNMNIATYSFPGLFLSLSPALHIGLANHAIFVNFFSSGFFFFAGIATNEND